MTNEPAVRAAPVYLFPGQGSQRRGMGEGLFEKYRQLVSDADACLGYSIQELCLHDPRRVLANTEYTQPALYVVNVLQYLDRVERSGEQPAYLVGHSLGEYCALHVAGAFDFVTGLKLVKRRGQLMSRAPKGAMAAVLNLDQQRVAEVLAALPYRNIDIANINSRTQTVLSGVHDELTAADVREAFLAAGGAFIPLNVSAAFHSRCMVGVEQEFARYLAEFEFGALRVPVVANYTARPYPTAGYADYLRLQISNSVRWYESISWLLARGIETFHEIGPGQVLSKLTESIRVDPLRIADEAPARDKPAGSRPALAGARPKLVFMYGGQGSQYYQMGRELYDTHPVFRGSMARCEARYRAHCGQSLVDAIYDDRQRGKEFDDIAYTHAALYAIGHSLTAVLREEGIRPDGVLGHSLGEYVALSVAGVFSFDDGLRIVMRQAELLKRHAHGGMLSVLAAPSMVAQRPDLFEGVSLAGVNYGQNFLLSGSSEALRNVQTKLEQLDVIAVRLPVRYGFHSELMEPIRREFLAFSEGFAWGRPSLPVYSSTFARALERDVPRQTATYLWSVARDPIRFEELMTSAFPAPHEHFFVDLSASGSFANFLKYGFEGKFRCVAAITQFGKNSASLANLRGELRSLNIAG